MAYEKELRTFFDLAPGEFPRFDCVLQGLGTDGHTASLFPDTDALFEKSRLVVANWIPSLQSRRITLTLPVLNNARLAMFLVSGDSKAEILKAVLAGSADNADYPARLIQPAGGQLLWLADRSAAHLIKVGNQA